MPILNIFRNAPKYVMEKPKLYNYSVAVNGDGKTSSTLEVKPLVTSAPFDQNILVTDLDIQTQINMGNLSQMRELRPMQIGNFDAAIHNAENFVAGLENTLYPSNPSTE